MYLYSFESGKCQSERSSSTADLVYWNTTTTKIIILRLSFYQEIKTKPQVCDKTKGYVCLCQQLKPPQVTGLWGSHHQTLFQVARLLFLKPLELALCGHAEQSCSLWAVDIYSSHWTLIWLKYLPANWAEAHFMGITKLLSVIMELGWNSHCWFSWKRSHLSILNHPLSTAHLFWNYRWLIWHLCPACRTSLFPCQSFRQQEIAPYFPKNAVISFVTAFWRADPKG